MQKEFTILLRRQIPFLSKASMFLICVCVVILALLWLILSPARASRAPAEMQAAYYIAVVPSWLKYLSGLAVLGMVILGPLNSLRRRTASALLILEDRFIISNKSVNITIPFAKVRKVFINDLANHKGELKNKLQVVINYRRRKSLAFFLANYEDAEELIQSLSVLNPDKFGFYDEKWLPATDTI